jgi:hypothetical protein
LEIRSPIDRARLVKRKFLTEINGAILCPAESAAGQALTLFIVDFIGLSNWPEACSPKDEMSRLQGFEL